MMNPLSSILVIAACLSASCVFAADKEVPDPPATPWKGLLPDGRSSARLSSPTSEILLLRQEHGNFHLRLAYRFVGPSTGPHPVIEYAVTNGLRDPVRGFDLMAQAHEPFKTNGWNQAEIVFWGGFSFHRLNTAVISGHTPLRSASGDLVISGTLQLRTGAEIEVRNAEIREIFEVPADLLLASPKSIAEDESRKMDLFGAGELAKWRQCGPGFFSVENGVATPKGGMGLWWYTGRTFTNFVMRGEFLQEETIADSGVFLRFADPGNDPWNAVRQGHEVEVGDPDPEIATWRTGSVYPFHASVTANPKPLGQWNSYQILALGHNYAVWLNGALVNTWTDYTHRSLKGYIGIQNYNDGKTVRHRSISVIPL